MGDPLRKVRSGQRLEIPAAAYNAFVDAAIDLQRRRQNALGDPKQAFRQTGTVLVRNDSGSDVPRFGVLGIDGPLIGPSDNVEEFKNRVALAGVTPVAADHTGKFVVTLEPIAAGEIGRAVISGIAIAKVNVADAGTTYDYADVADGQVDYLEAKTNTGSAQILWLEAGTGEKWAVVRLSNPGGGGSSFVAKVIDHQPDRHVAQVQRVEFNVAQPLDAATYPTMDLNDNFQAPAGEMIYVYLPWAFDWTDEYVEVTPIDDPYVPYIARPLWNSCEWTNSGSWPNCEDVTT